VKYIRKTNEPEVLVNFKARANKNWKLSYSKLKKKGEIKKKLQDYLIIEQGHLCCYCGTRISQADSHIEHFKPQSAYPSLDLDYFNMLVSCKNQIKPTEPIHCGFAKDHWFDAELLVSPLIADCEDFFKYTQDGQILPATNPESEKGKAATETIDKLCLNIDKLKAVRAGTIDSVYGDPDLQLPLSDDEIDKLIHYYSHIDDNGMYQPYCQSIVYLLKQEKMDRSK
jgi:uncharacterized protein (TIGR02646 family)